MALFQQWDGASGAMTWYDTETGGPVVWTAPGQSVTGGNGGTWSNTSNPASQAMGGLRASLDAAPMVDLSGATGPSANAPWYFANGKYYVPQIDYGLDPTSGMPTIQDGGFEIGNGSFSFPTYSGGRNVRISGGPANSLYGIELDTQPGTRSWQREAEGSFFGNVLSNFMSGPGVPLAGFMGAGAFNSGGLGNFLSSFGGGGGAAGAAGGAMDMGVGLNDVFGMGDVTGWGVNPQSGGNMDWWDDFINAVGDNYAPNNFVGDLPLDTTEVLRELSELPPATNLQDYITKMDANPATKAILNQQIGGWGDAVGKITLKDLLGTAGTAKNAVSLLGRLGAAGLGAYGANKQSKALSGLAGQYSEYGAPYRAMLAQSYANPSAFLANSPDIKAAVDQGTSALARALSVRGNPAQSGTALQEMQNYATQGLYGQLGNERQRLANFGGLTALTSAVPSLSAQAIGANSGMYNALGYGLQQATNPQPTIQDLLKMIGGTPAAGRDSSTIKFGLA